MLTTPLEPRYSGLQRTDELHTEETGVGYFLQYLADTLENLQTWVTNLFWIALYMGHIRKK
jgi:hypothetical protein